jgi:hypothetical protein
MIGEQGRAALLSEVGLRGQQRLQDGVCCLGGFPGVLVGLTAR